MEDENMENKADSTKIWSIIKGIIVALLLIVYFFYT